MIDADRLPLAAVALESPYRDRYSKSSAIFNKRWFDAGGLCLGLTDPACSTLALLSFSEHPRRAGGLRLSLANPSCSVDKIRLSTRIAIIAGSATGSIPELLATELLALLVQGREYSCFICLLSSAIEFKSNYSLEEIPESS